MKLDFHMNLNDECAEKADILDLMPALLAKLFRLILKITLFPKRDCSSDSQKEISG